MIQPCGPRDKMQKTVPVAYLSHLLRAAVIMVRGVMQRSLCASKGLVSIPSSGPPVPTEGEG